MALINCPECRTQISDFLPACPHCGASVVPWARAHAPSSPTGATAEKASASSMPNTILWIIGVVLVAIAGSLYFKARQAENEVREQEQRLQRLPDMPIQMSYGSTPTGTGMSVSFKNTSHRLLAVAVTIRNPSLNVQESFGFDLPPGETREIGPLEGWTFASGDTVRITHNDYKPLNGKVP